MNMKKYLYQVENGELSFDFEAPLLGDIEITSAFMRMWKIVIRHLE